MQEGDYVACDVSFEKGRRKRKGFNVVEAPPPLHQQPQHLNAGIVVTVTNAGYAFVKPAGMPGPDVFIDARYYDGSTVLEGDHVTFDLTYDAKDKRKGVNVRRNPYGGQ